MIAKERAREKRSAQTCAYARESEGGVEINRTPEVDTETKTETGTERQREREKAKKWKRKRGKEKVVSAGEARRLTHIHIPTHIHILTQIPTYTHTTLRI